ncbi:MAG: serine/threonine-protein kinase [Planctomycetota bacterium]|nr:serine/threonine-protein kinase [Planctomycetota bacterium]
MKFEYLGPYKVESILGRGGMGIVYRGIHNKSGDVVAIKIISTVLADQERFRRRFAAEVETVKRLKQPNIVQLIGYGEEQGHLFYSMEYVQGVNLADHLKQNGPLTWERAIEIGIEICAALKHAHDMGIIHRDLKPANVMLNESGQVKLTDFGIAKLFGSSDATAAGSVLGTADFMPPEQAEGKVVTNRSDLYALGALLYCALTGRSPQAAKTLPEVLYNVRYTIPKPLDVVDSAAPKELSELVAELLAKDPAARPPTALVVSNRLQSLKIGLKHREQQTKIDLQPSAMNDAAQSREFNSLDLFEDAIGSPDAANAGAKPSSTPNASPPQPSSFGTDQTQVVPPDFVPNRSRTRAPIRTDIANANTKSASQIEPVSHLTGVSMYDEPAAPGVTRFTVVEENERRRATLSEHVEELPNPWVHNLSIGALILLLLGSLSAIYIFTRPQSADQLYQQLSQAIESTNPDDLFDVEPMLEQFSELYPNDSRQSDFDSIRQDIQQQKALRRLERRARISSVQSDLDPLEQAFMEAMKAREEDTDVAAKKLRALLTIYSDPATLTERQQQLVAMAENALEEIQKGIEQKTHPATEALNERIDWATKNLSDDMQKAFFQSVIELYADKPWAKSAVARAKASLTK